MQLNRALIALVMLGPLTLAHGNISEKEKWKPKYQQGMNWKESAAQEVKDEAKYLKKLDMRTLPEAVPAQVRESKNTPAPTPTPAAPPATVDQALLEDFKKDYKKKEEFAELKKKTMAQGPKAVSTLTYILKTDSFPDKNRWIAMFYLGQIMGKKSSAYVSKYLSHPNFILRLAALKTLLALKDTQYGGPFALSLNDPSLLVRAQAMENIRQLKLSQYAPFVWKMLLDPQNYAHAKDGKKRTFIIPKAIRALGDLGFTKANKPLLKMIQNKRYQDIFGDLDYSLSKLTGKKSPEGAAAKQAFWSREELKHKTL